MALTYAPGDDLVFQMESGFGLMRVLGSEGEGREAVWHVLVYQDFYADVESAEAALAAGLPLGYVAGALAWGLHVAFDRAIGLRPRSPDGFQRAESW